MKLASVLTPLSVMNLRLAAQCGVEGVVIRYPGPALEELLALAGRPREPGKTDSGTWSSTTGHFWTWRGRSSTIRRTVRTL